MRQKKCKICENKFTPQRPLQMVCSVTCGYAYANKVKAKEWSKEKKIRKEQLMTRSEHLNLLQKVFNAYIRARDKDKPCISCGTYSGKMSAGHYMSVGSTPELRFNETNVHKQCFRCNSELSANLIKYRINLVDLIGAEAVDELERKNHPPLKLTIDEIKEQIKIYRQKTKEL